MSTTINEIRTFTRKGQGSWARARTRSKGKICGKCGTSHPPRECPVWGKKCHKCGNKDHFSTQCRSRQLGGGDRQSHSTSRGCKGKGKCQQSRLRSNQVTKSAHSIESASFQDHSTTINEIRTFTRKGQGSQARARTRSKGKICGKCGTSHPPRECPVWGKKCHKCGNKNHFSTQCRSKQSGGGDRRSRSTSRGHKGKGKHQQSRSRSNQATKSAYSIESASFQDHSGNLHRDSADLHGQQRGQTGDLHGTSNSTEFLSSHFL